MYAYIKKRLTLPIFSILLLLAFATCAYGGGELFIEDNTLQDIKITIKDEHSYVVANLFIRDNDGNRVYLRAFLITSENSLILPFGIGAYLQWQGDITITTKNILVPGYSMPTVTYIAAHQATNPEHITNPEGLRFAMYCRDHGLRRMIRTDVITNVNYELFEQLLRDITRLGLRLLPTCLECITPDGTPITLRPAGDFITPPKDHGDILRLQPMVDNAWNHLTGNYPYIMPAVERENLSVIPPYVIAEIYYRNTEQSEQPKVRLELLRRFTLAPGETLPPFPGLSARIIPVGYKNPSNLRLRCILPHDQAITPNLNPPTNRREILNGVREMHRIVAQHGENWRMYERVLTTLERIRPQFFLEAFPPPENPAPQQITVVAETEENTTAPAPASRVSEWLVWGLGFIIPTEDPDYS